MMEGLKFPREFSLNQSVNSCLSRGTADLLGKLKRSPKPSVKRHYGEICLVVCV